ncbi:MFS transporter [Actinomycetes bacterium KLBMP 9797]
MTWRAGWGGDFDRLWRAYAVSEFGTALAMGALPLVAVLVLQTSDLQVSLLAALAGVASVVLTLPLGPWIEFRRKRPVMIGADLLRFAALASVPLAGVLGILTYAQLCVVAVVQAVGTIAFASAGAAHLKALVPIEHRTVANSRLEATFWTANSVGPPIGGVLVSWLGATASLAVDALSFLLSAVGIRRLRGPEPPPPTRRPNHHWGRELTAGWRHIMGHRGLRALFWNAMIFGGCIVASSPLLTVFMLRDLGFPAWQYGLALGVPAVAAVLGSMLVKPLTRSLGDRTVLLIFGVARSLWLGLVPLAAPSTTGLILIIVADSLLLLCAGTFNPTFATYRMNATDDSVMSRVVLAWSISNKCVQPVFIAGAGALAALTNARTALAVLAVLLLTSAALLPWRTNAHAKVVTIGDDQRTAGRGRGPSRSWPLGG